MQIHLNPGREKNLLKGHPWIFSRAVGRVTGEPTAGDTVAIHAADGTFLAWGTYSPESSIRVRAWSWDEHVPVDRDLLAARLAESIARRDNLPYFNQTNARRLVHGESDRMPGLVVDQYADVLVVQFLSWSVERWREEITACLGDLIQPAAIYERSDADVRTLEGLEQRVGWLAGEPKEMIEIQEDGLRYQVNVVSGQKTGFYLDQRANRAMVRQLAAGRKVLNGFAYTGGFTLACLAGGAELVLSVDTSAPALEAAQANLALNDLPADRASWEVGDMFYVLRKLRDRGESFDMVILDPPKFAPTSAQVDAASRGYKDINLLGLKLLRPGGLLVTFSCSGGITPERFQQIIAGAAEDAHVHACIHRVLTQDADHPVALNFPEGHYLKGLVVGV